MLPRPNLHPKRNTHRLIYRKDDGHISVKASGGGRLRLLRGDDQVAATIRHPKAVERFAVFDEFAAPIGSKINARKAVVDHYGPASNYYWGKALPEYNGIVAKAWKRVEEVAYTYLGTVTQSTDELITCLKAKAFSLDSPLTEDQRVACKGAIEEIKALIKETYRAKLDKQQAEMAMIEERG